MAHNKLTLACFDESGKFQDSGVIALAGCVAFPSTLESLANAWEKRIKGDGIPFTSMKEAMHFQGPYLKWKETPDKRDALLRDLAHMIVDAPMLRVATPIVTAEFKALPQTEREKLGGDPQYGAFEACILGTLYPRRDTDVHLVFDLSEQYSEKCVSLFH